MEMTESYRQPALELSKSDFFNFVTSNDITDAQYKEQMRSVNVFMESPDSRSNPLLSEEPKEQNNNVLLSGAAGSGGPLTASGGGGMATATTALQSFDSIWNADRDRGRLEDAMLEDLNYWTHESDASGAQTCSATGGKLGDNTDGHIYTLTVQEVSDQTTNRYWCKEEDVSMSSPNEIEQIQNSSLDLESILNIMPHQINGFPNDFSQDSLNQPLPKVETFNYEETENESRGDELGCSAHIKVEPYSFEEGEYSASDHKNELHSPVAISTPLLEGQIEFNNNNNDWKLTDQNSESNESLLRSALQGKAFIRYSAIQKSSGVKLDSSAELKRVIINNNNNKSDVPCMYAKDGANDSIVMTLNTMQPNGVNIVLFEEPGATVTGDGDNPTSTQSVDDILLSQLDASYPEDLEKLKRIASELGESVQQYCTVEPASGVYNVHHLNGELVTMIPAGDVQLPQAHLQIVTASPAVSSSKCANKKYKRGSKSSSPASMSCGGGGGGGGVGGGGAQSSVQTATSTSNGIRKERSLHYCSICSKGFKDKYSVNVHVRTHTGEKPFSCSLCGKSFRQKAHLAKHYQTHIAQKTATANGGAVKSNKQR